MPLGSAQGVSSTELMEYAKTLNHSPVTDEIVVQHNTKKSCLEERFKFDDTEDNVFVSQVFYPNSCNNSDLGNSYKLNDDWSRYLNPLKSNESMDFNASSSFSDISIPNVLSLLRTDEIDISAFNLELSDLYSIPKPDDQNDIQVLATSQNHMLPQFEQQGEDCRLDDQLSREIDAFLTSNDIDIPSQITSDSHISQVDQLTLENPLLRDNSALELLSDSGLKPLDQLQFQITQPTTEPQQIKLRAYMNDKGSKRGTCSGCNKDRAIAISWDTSEQMCYACRRIMTRMGVCSICAKYGDANQKVIQWRYGTRDQICGDCRRRTVNIGICSMCVMKHQDDTEKLIIYHFRKADQMCGNCRKREISFGVCSRCRRHGDSSEKMIEYSRGKKNQMCGACRKLKLKKKKLKQETDYQI